MPRGRGISVSDEVMSPECALLLPGDTCRNTRAAVIHNVSRFRGCCVGVRASPQPTGYATNCTGLDVWHGIRQEPMARGQWLA